VWLLLPLPPLRRRRRRRCCCCCCCCCCRRPHPLKTQVSIGATLQLSGHTFKVPLTIQKLQIHVIARITGTPMMAHYPYLGSVGVTLLEAPHVDFELPVGGVDVMALPMLRTVVRAATRLAAHQFVVFPR
jgi:Ca2+-dependent lipid-binding protein